MDRELNNNNIQGNKKMPYITEDKRNQINNELLALVDKLKTMASEERAGNLNYIITFMINELYPVNKYRELNDAIGMLECCKQELYRRRVGPYEDVAIDKNGDMPNYPPIEKPIPPAVRIIKETLFDEELFNKIKNLFKF